ncbi:hypothetical protein E4665_01590 [Sporolactobacillus shoreae]|uniref:Uncharacterized protein n=1 Tax=Sporolactobacillus shoreae TaxID=1465501 RepID=A0A4Z0GV28_9BACL|nr:hypothetical protein [Sporolactobacillus shoreae]TGB00397.1 hypothetical protein E4665_01590 [Sporolactobacillus shoreae]
MSFVSIIASPEWASVVSDGQLVDLAKNGERTVLPGMKPSVLRISEQQLLVCTGSASILKIIREKFPFQKGAYVINESSIRIMEELVRSVPFESQDVLVALVDASGPVNCRLFSNSPNDSWQTLTPDHKRLASLFLAGRNINEEKIKRISNEFNRLILIYGKETANQVVEAQKDLNRLAGEFDHTVSQRIYRFLLQR